MDYLPGWVFVESVEDEAEANGWKCAVSYGFNVEFVFAFENDPVMHLFAVEELVEP